MKTNQDYKNAALAALKGNWAPAVLATVVFFLIAIICILPSQIWALRNPLDPASVSPAEIIDYYKSLLPVSILASLLYIFVLYPLEVGYDNACLRLLRNGENDLTGNTFRITLKGYARKAWGMFLMGLFTALWTMLFVIPGIVKVFSYAMTPFILEENPELSANQAIDRSRAMMKGHKFDLFYLGLSFIGWGLLCILTLGIGFLWLIPYVQTSISAFYEDVKAEYEQIAMD